MIDNKQIRILALLGAVNGFLAVALGAFGAHALKDRLSPMMLEVYKTGVQYHMAHALALLLVALMVDRWRGNAMLIWSGRLFAAGILLFSGSLYLLAITGVRALGAITPLGGLCFLGGWLLLAMAAFREN